MNNDSGRIAELVVENTRLRTELAIIKERATRLMYIRDMYPGIAWLGTEERFYGDLMRMDLDE